MPSASSFLVNASRFLTSKPIWSIARPCVPTTGVGDGVKLSATPGRSAVTNADRAYGHLLILGPAKHGYFSSPSQMPGALIEPLFITNPTEATLADSRRGEQAMAAGIARAAVQYLGAHRARG